MQISEKTRLSAQAAEAALADIFRDIDEVSRRCTEHVLDVFRENRISESMFAPSTGYGYGDDGRDICEAGKLPHGGVSLFVALIPVRDVPREYYQIGLFLHNRVEKRVTRKNLAVHIAQKNYSYTFF